MTKIKERERAIFNMKKFYLIKFNKKIKEEILVNVVNNIIKNLCLRGYSFYLDNLLIDEGEYHLTFSGDLISSKVLVKEINDFLKINSHKIIN